MQKQFNNGSILCTSLKRLIRDLKPFKGVDFILNDSEISKLSKYPRYRQAYEAYRASGEAPDSFGVIVGFSDKQEQFFILPRSFCEKLSVLLNKKLSELTSEERTFLMDDSSEETVDVLEGSLV